MTRRLYKSMDEDSEGGGSPSGDTGFINVAIRREIHDRANEEASRKGVSARKYESDLLEMALEQQEFLDRYAPFLQLHSVEGEFVYISDSKKKILAEVKLMKNEMGLKDSYCVSDKDFGCIHAKYALMLPALRRLKW